MNLTEARDVLIFHSKSKRNGNFDFKITHESELTNPICGDFIQIKLHVEKDQIIEAGFLAKACAICSASASMLCEEIRSKTAKQALELSQEFENGVLSSQEIPWPQSLLGLKSFEHLKVNHTRRACALLPWVALRSLFKEARV